MPALCPIRNTWFAFIFYLNSRQQSFREYWQRPLLQSHRLSKLEGLTLSGDGIDSIKCYLTGGSGPDGGFDISRFSVQDKHGKTRSVFNAKVNIYRRDAEPIFLGLQESDLTDFGQRDA